MKEDTKIREYEGVKSMYLGRTKKGLLPNSRAIEWWAIISSIFGTGVEIPIDLEGPRQALLISILILSLHAESFAGVPI